MDSKTLKKVLGQVSQCVSCKDQYLSHPHARVVVYQQAGYVCLSELETWLSGESAELGEFSRF